MRRARSTLNLFKLLKVLGLITDPTTTVKDIQNLYYEYLDLDGKPEKGERKVADDCVLLINEILESSDSNMDATVMFRMGLLESALERSPYNFDISVALLKIYDEHGLSTSFN